MAYEEVSTKYVTDRSHGEHRVKTTSINVYFNLENLGKRQQMVYDAIVELNETGICPTDLEIMKHLGFFDPNKVRPRRYDLFHMGLIEDAGTKYCPVSKKLVTVWRAFDVEPIFDKQGDVLVQKSLSVPYEDWKKLKEQMEKRGFKYDGNGRWKK